MKLEDLFENRPTVNRIVWRKRADKVEKSYDKTPVLHSLKHVEVKDKNAKQ